MEKRTSNLRDYSNVPVPMPNYKRPRWYLESRRKAEKEKKCLFCGRPVKGRKKYCGEDCRWHGSLETAIGQINVSSLRRYIHQRFNFECQDCGVHLSKVMESGVEFPVFGGDVHHILPLHRAGKNDWNNLTLLCRGCHGKAHRGKR